MAIENAVAVSPGADNIEPSSPSFHKARPFISFELQITVPKLFARTVEALIASKR